MPDYENDPDCIKGVYADEWLNDFLNPAMAPILIGLRLHR